MNKECKECAYLKKCPDFVEPNSIYCKCHKRIPKDRTMSYEELEQKVNQLETNRDDAIKELFILKDMIYKPETREENFEIQRKISSILIELERGKE